MRKRSVLIHCFIFLLLWAGWLIHSCTDPFNPVIPPSEGILVVDGGITNELTTHKILLSRSTQGEDEPRVESGATVRIVDSNQQSITFIETEPGTYESPVFAAQTNTSYQLLVSTAEGRSYSSSSVELPQTTQIDRVYAEASSTDSGLNGVEIFVDSFDPSGNSVYYKYEYEETYKIIAPNWVPDELVVVSEENQAVAIVRRTEEERTCFATNKSNSIIITNTSRAEEDRVSRFSVRFLNQDNLIISHRYSILVKQHVMSRRAFEFYEKLQDFSGSEGLFSESQPGFITGNIFPNDGGDDRVVGIFEVSSVSERRIFFNYDDFFPEEELPPFVNDCRQTNIPANDGSRIFGLVQSNTVSYVGSVTDPSTGALLEYIIVPRICGDCNELGSSTVPDFWEE